MRSMTMTKPARAVAATLLTAAMMFVALAALPSASNSGGGLLSRVAPQAAQAFQGGVDGDHVWLKVTNGDIAAGTVSAACAVVTSDVPYAYPICPPIAATAKMIIGDSAGVWFAIYSDGHYEYGTW
jgi:hypothetical protein